MLLRYDSVVDNTDTPAIHVIFHDNKACPRYIVKFRRLF